MFVYIFCFRRQYKIQKRVKKPLHVFYMFLRFFVNAKKFCQDVTTFGANEVVAVVLLLFSLLLLVVLLAVVGGGGDVVVWLCWVVDDGGSI